MKLIKIISLNLILFFTCLVFSESSETISDCPELLDHELRVLDSNKTENLCKYKDKVILAVNVASRCGFTYQYESLQALYEEYAEKDFNKNCFINVENFSSLEEAVEHIKMIDEDNEIYDRYLTEPIFKNNEIPERFKPENILKYFEENILC